MTTLFTRRTVVALSAYLRRIELSLQRSLGEDARKLRDYLDREVQPPVAVVAEWAASFGSPAKTATPTECFGPSLLWGRLQLLLRGRVAINANHVAQIGSLLQQLLAELEVTDVVDRGFAPIRLELCLASIALLGYVPDVATRERILRVEHLNQNLFLPTEPFETIAEGPGWMTPCPGQTV